VERAKSIGQILGHIDAAMKLAQGVRSTAVRLDPEESQRITENVVALRDTPLPDGSVRTWADIAKEIGLPSPDAAQKRYQKYKSMQVEASAPSPAEAAPKPEKQISSRGVPIKIPHSEDDNILKLREDGHSFAWIRDDLRSRGIDCETGTVQTRYYDTKKKLSEDGKMRHNDPTAREIAQHERIEKANGDKEPVPISRAELDQKIWDMWKNGMSPKQISEALNLEGYYYGEQSVRVRLRAQGAEI